MTKDMILFWMPEYLGAHAMAWRRDRSRRTLEMDFGLICRQAQVAERGKLHGLMLTDTVAVGYYASSMTKEALGRTAKGSRWEPLTLLSAIATSTSRIGLIAPVSTSYSEPYNAARMIASLDHISAGRAGWAVDCAVNAHSDANFGASSCTAHQGGRHQEFINVVSGLWDSWEDDAFVRDKASGRYFDPAKLHALNHRGPHLSVAGPLNIARPVQGQPVIVQTGPAVPESGFPGGDVVCAWHPGIEAAKAFYDAVKSGAAARGQDPEGVKVLAALVLAVGRSRVHAEEKVARLDSLLDPVFGRELLSTTLALDLSDYPLDLPVSDVSVDPAKPSTVRQYYLDVAKRDGLTIRQLMEVVARVSVIPGSAADIADMMQRWFEAGAADGFAITFDSDEESLEIFVDTVVPELQQRGLFQRDYRASSLRENLGLPRPVNRYIATP